MREWGDYIRTWLPEGSVKESFSLRDLTTLRVGGIARWVATVSARNDLIRLLRETEQHGIPWYLLGGGSNVLFSDSGFDGLVVVNKVKEPMTRTDYLLDVSSGHDLMDVVRKAQVNELAGIESLAGIPGSLGGAIVGNAGAFGQNIAEVLESVDLLLTTGEVVTVKPEELLFNYRESRLKRDHDVVLSARLRLVEGNKELLAQKINEILKLREEKHPHWDVPTAGSFFKNLPPLEPGGRRIAAGLILDSAGARGLQVGDAAVFEKHANIIINKGQATAAQILALTSIMKKKAFEAQGIHLEEEVRLVGFSPEELAAWRNNVCLFEREVVTG